VTTDRIATRMLCFLVCCPLLTSCQSLVREVRLVPDLFGYVGPLEVNAILNGKLYLGKVVVKGGETLSDALPSGTFDLYSTDGSDTTCSGQFQFLTESARSSYHEADEGVAELRCSNGIYAVYALKQTSSQGAGYGRGRTTDEYSTLVYGHRLDAADGAKHLVLPPGHRLIDTIDGPRLTRSFGRTQ
jgi:hypothetical protein